MTRARVSPLRRLAWVYAAIFITVVVIGYLPGFTNAQGQLLGLFTIDPIDDLLHLGSGVWAAVAAWRSRVAALWYFRLFGPAYFLDGVLGFLFGQGYLDGGLFRYGPAALPLLTRLFANLPHLLLGGIALAIGFLLPRYRARVLG